MRGLIIAILVFTVSTTAKADLLGDLLGGIFGDMPISKVMSRCDVGNNIDNFSYYTACIKTTYGSEGNHPNHPVIKAFYSQLDVIDEHYRQGKISNIEAKAYAYKSWQSTIDNQSSQSQSNEAARSESIRKLNDPAQWNQQAPPLPTVPRKLNCQKTGANTTCW